MSEILSALEDRISSQCYIDVEINSLEDAYINIAKEEEKLLRRLQQNGVQRFTETRYSLNERQDVQDETVGHHLSQQKNEQNIARYSG
jgi:hypothetical protein